MKHFLFFLSTPFIFHSFIYSNTSLSLSLCHIINISFFLLETFTCFSLPPHFYHPFCVCEWVFLLHILSMFFFSYLFFHNFSWSGSLYFFFIFFWLWNIDLLFNGSFLLHHFIFLIFLILFSSKASSFLPFFRQLHHFNFILENSLIILPNFTLPYFFP